MSMRNILILLCTTLAMSAPPAPDGKMAIAVLNLKNATGVTNGEAELLSDRLRIEFFNTGKFTVMERDQMQQVLKEQGFQQSGACTDEACMVEIGQLLGVKQLVTGSIGKLGNMYMVNIRSIDVQTGRISKVVSEDVKGDIEDLVGVLPGIAARLAGDQKSERVVTDKSDRRREEPRQEEPVKEKETKKPESDATCGGRIFMEMLQYTKDDLGMDMPLDDYKDLNENINDELKDAFDEVFDDRTTPVTRQQLAAIPSCTDPVIRVTLDKYTTKAARFGQVEGTAEITLSFYESAGAAAPAFRVRVIKAGDVQKGLKDPMIETFKAINEEIQENLDRQEYVRKLKKRMKI